MAINKAGADTYFSPTTHVNAALWSNFTPNQRTAAIAQAKRQLSRALRMDLNENEAAYTGGVYVMESYACYEQALYLLLNSQIANAMGADPQPTITGMAEVDTGAIMNGAFGFATAALEWLNWSGAATVRG
jgi:hypothetical protein